MESTYAYIPYLQNRLTYPIPSVGGIEIAPADTRRFGLFVWENSSFVSGVGVPVQARIFHKSESGVGFGWIVAAGSPLYLSLTTNGPMIFDSFGAQIAAGVPTLTVLEVLWLPRG